MPTVTSFKKIDDLSVFLFYLVLIELWKKKTFVQFFSYLTIIWPNNESTSQISLKESEECKNLSV